MDFYFIVFFIYFSLGIFSFVSGRKHLLSTLLSLEFLVLGFFFYFFVILIFFYWDLYFLMYFLTFSVCEGALGLSVLVILIRSHGSDSFGVFNLVQC